MPATPVDRSSAEAQQLIAFLNAIQVGALDAIRAQLAEARRRCEALGQPELALKLTEAETALDGGDMKTYRKRIESVISRLGHLR